MTKYIKLFWKLYMKSLLEKSVHALISGDAAAAKAFFKEYATAKSRAILEEKMKADSDVVKGHCEDCGEDATTTRAIKTSGKWTCGNCGGKKHVASEAVKESSDNIDKGAFHRWLGKPEDEKITDADIEKGLRSKNKHVRKMAQYAHNVRE
jgi:ribosomal protein L37AE/L43A